MKGFINVTITLRKVTASETPLKADTITQMAHLDKSGLAQIIKNMGSICRVNSEELTSFPRFELF